MRNHGSKMLCQEGETRNGNIPLPPAKGNIRSKPKMARKKWGTKNIQFANWSPSRQRNREQIKRNKPSRCVNGSAPRKIKLANIAKNSKALITTGPAIWSVYCTVIPIRGSHALHNIAYGDAPKGPGSRLRIMVIRS